MELLTIALLMGVGVPNVRWIAGAASAAIAAMLASWGADAQSPATLQDKCEFHANLAFREWFEYRKAEAKFWDEDLVSLSADYQSYYNPRLRHCLFLVEESASSKRTRSRVSFIRDIDAQREYAFYLADENKVIVCELKATADHETFCKTRGEFNNFVAGYMENDANHF